MLRALSLDLPDPDDAVATAATLRGALADAKVVHFRARAFSPASLPDWERIAGGIGTLMANGEESASGIPDGSVWIDVRYDPAQPNTFRHSRTAQPPHTDDAYKALADSAEYVLFLVEHPARDGGETYFIDAAELAGYIGEHDPRMLHELTTIPIQFAKAGIAGKTTPVLVDTGAGWEVCWNYYNLAPGQGEAIADLRERFQALLLAPETMARLAYGFRLDTDEGVVWHDRKVLHGRTAFAADALGDRILWKCCIG